VGRVVNGFEIQKLIGQGKFSFVFRAKRIQDNVLVALKLIKVSLTLQKLPALTKRVDFRHGQRETA
jgi:serine/threonine protein kinase